MGLFNFFRRGTHFDDMAPTDKALYESWRGHMLLITGLMARLENDALRGHVGAEYKQIVETIRNHQTLALHDQAHSGINFKEVTGYTGLGKL